MLQISYDTGCRTCLKSEGIRSMYMIKDGNLNDFKKKTEYEVMLQVEDWREEDSHVCRLCGSPNVEITNVFAGDYPLYDYENLVGRSTITDEEMFMLNIDKGQYGVDANDGGKNYPDIEFVRDCFLKLIEIVSEIPDDKFVSHKKGNFFVCFTGDWAPATATFSIKVERFRFHGVSKADISEGVNRTLLQYGLGDISMKTESRSSSRENPKLDFVWKSSDHLRFENGRQISGPHGGAPRAFKIENNINGGKGYTITMFNIEGGAAVVQMAPKQMAIVNADESKFVLRGYGYDASGSSFADYGLTLYHKKGVIEKMILHMHDRNIDIEYLP